MRTLLRLALAGAVLSAALAANIGPVLAGTDTIKVSCSNGFERTVSARAARGVAKALTKFNEHRGSNVTCTAGPGAPRPQVRGQVTVTCSNGFERRVDARAAGGISKALNVFNARSRSGVTCSLA
jgi:hypothetical protein